MQFDRLGPYKIVKQIGKGGMGAVYEAVADRPGAQQGLRVAIKALSPQMAAAEGFRERFESEILSMMQLSHEGIVQIYGKGEQDGILFYAMELVEGTSLEEEIASGRRFNWRETLRVGIQVCRALKHAHDVGVVHRDIKPANLLLTPEGRVKIADFGIARFFHNTQLTTAGGVLGTADYMSPEQADGRQVTERCDQYSLGGVMYALLAGRPPFQAKTMPEMLQLQRFAEPEPVRRYAKETPDQLNKLITQLLAKDPEKRFPNVLVLSRHMEAMEKALSRPIDETAQRKGGNSGSPRQTAPNLDKRTRATPASLKPNDETRSEPHSTDIYSAATLDIPTDEDDATGAEIPLTHEPLHSSYTSIDEEKRRQQEQAGSVPWSLYGQFLLLVLTITMIVWGGWQLMRPSSADELYQEIEQAVSEDGDDGLRSVDDELEEFARRFGDDPRNEQLDGYRQQLEFLRFERQVRTKTRIHGARAESPLASVYLEAMHLSESSPEKAAKMLEAIVTLYDPLGKATPETPADQVAAMGLSKDDVRWLALARQRIAEFRTKQAASARTLIPALNRRLSTAAALETSQPEQAQKMYQALILLYDQQPWAEPVVAKAREALDRLTESDSE